MLGHFNRSFIKKFGAELPRSYSLPNSDVRAAAILEPLTNILNERKISPITIMRALASGSSEHSAYVALLLRDLEAHRIDLVWGERAVLPNPKKNSISIPTVALTDRSLADMLFEIEHQMARLKRNWNFEIKSITTTREQFVSKYTDHWIEEERDLWLNEDREIFERLRNIGLEDSLSTERACIWRLNRNGERSEVDRIIRASYGDRVESSYSRAYEMAFLDHEAKMLDPMFDAADESFEIDLMKFMMSNVLLKSLDKNERRAHIDLVVERLPASRREDPRVTTRITYLRGEGLRVLEARASRRRF